MKKYKELFNFDKEQNKLIIGTDEAGRGSGVGAVFAAAACFKEFNKDLIERLVYLNDSKKVSKKHRDELYEIIKTETINSVVSAEVDIVERVNILNASLYAMRQAVENVKKEVNCEDFIVFVDGNKNIPALKYPQRFIIKGDGTSATIAAASILAKVERDRYMLKLDKEYPQYDWASNMGYLTKDHMAAIDKFGATPYHRMSYLEKHFAKQEQLNLFQ